ncbi:protein argonaute 3-like [Leguminivora glycinivorella]|uniref:protein argonaute 3-like n=1 Tax=Leguminivora glycinivorella TaxID=1035111 RepID=UPI002010AA64|nr:protein argonaute 3-like [Leguminivora glycinivorella]
MPKTYESVVTALETIGDLKLNIVKDRLLAEEEKQKKYYNKYPDNRGQSTSFNCFVCGKPGHKKYQCRGNGRGNIQGHRGYQGQRDYHGQGQRNYQGQEHRGYQEQGHGSGSWNRGRSFNRGQGGYNGPNRGTGYNQGRGHSSTGRPGQSTNFVEDESAAFYCGNI